MSDAQNPIAAPEPALIQTPDQLQQARRPERAPRQGGTAAAPGDAPRQPVGGVLLQLQTERAHG